jgi:hypothetical protein
VSFDGHRSNDFTNYLYRSTDFGNTWTSIAGDMPANRVIHAVHEDPNNANLIYAATEHGLYISGDAGAHWIELRANMPRVPVYDLVIHPRDNDLVLATHGRGVWILDDVSALQQLTPQILAEPAHLFAPRAAEQIRYFNPRAHQGDMIFRGENPPAGALIDYYLRSDPGGAVEITVLDAAAKTVATVPGPRTAGLNRAVWNLRSSALPAAPPDEESGGPSNPIAGPLVIPGEYTVRLVADGRTYEQKVQVLEDPRIQIPAADRKAWTDALVAIGESYRSAAALLEQAAGRGASGAELATVARELQSRLLSLYRDVAQSTAKPTADQQAQMQFYETGLRSLRARIAR